jgi:hypothetical protein
VGEIEREAALDDGGWPYLVLAAPRTRGRAILLTSFRHPGFGLWPGWLRGRGSDARGDEGNDAGEGGARLRLYLRQPLR